MPHTRLKKQKGFSLLEVMIAALILSTGLLGVASLQIVSMKGTQQSSMKNQAMGVVQNITERMRANHEGVINSRYLVATNITAFDCTTAAPNCAAGTCTAANIATADLHNLICGFGNTPRTGGVSTVATGDIGILVNGSLDIACAGPVPITVPPTPPSCAEGDVKITVQWDESALGEETVIRDSLILTTRIAAP
ncbi:MAG: type IV pilus modification protein PilV [Cocleimonas sp.]|nr:type IV pilus modification protein PilV [Cocleimonas sp.]